MTHPPRLSENTNVFLSVKGIEKEKTDIYEHLTPLMYILKVGLSISKVKKSFTFCLGHFFAHLWIKRTRLCGKTYFIRRENAKKTCRFKSFTKQKLKCVIAHNVLLS